MYSECVQRKPPQIRQSGSKLSRRIVKPGGGPKVSRRSRLFFYLGKLQASAIRNEQKTTQKQKTSKKNRGRSKNKKILKIMGRQRSGEGVDYEGSS
jgi:hypothetical protein